MKDVLLPANYRSYLEKFTKREYGPCFDAYLELTAPFFEELELYPDRIPGLAEEFVSQLEKTLPGPLARRLAIYDLCQFLFLFTVPAALHRGRQTGEDFADALVSQWNDKFPKNTLNKASFSQINGGFKKRIMGFDFDIGRD